MKLKGEVEVFKILSDGTRHSALKESNMVVDGAAEVIVDMLTTPYSIKNTTGSASLDVSNFGINAVSLGKAEKLYGGHPDTSAADSDVIGMHAFWNNFHLSTTYTTCCDPVGEQDLGCDDFYGARALKTGYGGSSFVPSLALPKDPSPLDRTLENSSKTQIELYYELSSEGTAGIPENTAFTRTFGTPSGWNDASNIISPPGHNVNAMYGRINKSTESLFQGCYAPSDGIDIYIWDPILTRGLVTLLPAALANTILDYGDVSSLNVSGKYNEQGVMDERGYLVAYPIQDHPASGGSDGLVGVNGVVVSAATTSSLDNLQYSAGGLLDSSTAFIGSPALCFNFSISSSDLQALAAYKGVTNIGLWALDAKETFKNESAPVEWRTGDPDRGVTNNRKYKLFAKKVFSEDLTSIYDYDDGGGDPLTDQFGGLVHYQNLNIQWRMNFAFGRSF